MNKAAQLKKKMQVNYKCKQQTNSFLCSMIPTHVKTVCVLAGIKLLCGILNVENCILFLHVFFPLARKRLTPSQPETIGTFHSVFGPSYFSHKSEPAAAPHQQAIPASQWRRWGGGGGGGGGGLVYLKKPTHLMIYHFQNKIPF